MSRGAAIFLVRTGMVPTAVALLEAVCRTGLVSALAMLAPGAIAAVVAEVIVSGDAPSTR